MSTPLVRASGAITTTGIATTARPGVLSYAQSSSSSLLRLYDGASSAGVLIASLPADTRQSYDPPVQFQTALWSVPGSTLGTTDSTVISALVHYS